MKKGLKIAAAAVMVMLAAGVIGVWTMVYLKNTSAEENPTAAETNWHPQQVQDYGDTENPEYADAGGFIKKFHEFYNQTTGWERINDLNMPDQIARAEAAKAYAGYFIPLTEDPALKNDLEAIIMHADSVIAGNAETVLTLHRYFHDLDIAVNGYVHEQIFGVTESK
ncbi:hypothetical protein SLL00_11205 [Metabacillus indicus]|uniref:hypothetical protein n=1 Tax=Metabacillus indicus TaxID=246786 RepID=UPI0029FF57C3|nr:hypothetical protein [Metabacillus indicus]MDX8290366.1 hypothetical protein [Metabacillus indicus]